jgi:predicted amidophosphoribosyltransferase
MEAQMNKQTKVLKTSIDVYFANQIESIADQEMRSVSQMMSILLCLGLKEYRRSNFPGDYNEDQRSQISQLKKHQEREMAELISDFCEN